MKTNFVLKKSELIDSAMIVLEIDENNKHVSAHYVSTIIIDHIKEKKFFNKVSVLQVKFDWLQNNHPELLL